MEQISRKKNLAAPTWILANTKRYSY